MATRHPFSGSFVIQEPASNRRPGNRLLMCANNQIRINSKLLQIRSSIRNKVFEDLSSGIVCYKDDNGEITCEGYDEGPRYLQKSTKITCDSRDVEIVDLFHRCWLQAADDNEPKTADKGVSEHKGLNCNGFNTLC
ncbi:Hypothetical predicted protein [Olea europaea subsp. europaea]|uniref:Uncharacterized protein n=1 Tax=Olea europaea subsp. europaea TaxID=158383 RepID=A0A8S0TV70_OLEEU|nr:Hypothetical predicted protein [Olea europaea subsp. europaea]